MKWLIGIVTAGLMALTGCITPTASADTVQFVVAEKALEGKSFKFPLGGETVTNISYVLAPEILEARLAKQEKLENNAARVKRAVKALLDSQTDRRTRYVFSGASPSGWDCSGLVLWTYQQIGVELPHRASEQGDLGRKVAKPKYGDIVVFKYKGYKSAYHVGIYLGDDTMIHAPMPGQSTQQGSIEEFGGNYSSVSYIRILEH